MSKYKLRDLVSFTQGIQVPISKQYSECNDDRIRFIRIVDFTKNTSNEIRYIDYKKNMEKAIINEDDIAIIRYGSQTVGDVVRGFSGVIANNLFKVNIISDFCDKDYMYFYFLSEKFVKFVKNSQTSSTMPAISFELLYNMEIDLPSIEKQKEIVSYLLPIYKKIELSKKNIDILEEYKKIAISQFYK